MGTAPTKPSPSPKDCKKHHVAPKDYDQFIDADLTLATAYIYCDWDYFIYLVKRSKRMERVNDTLSALYDSREWDRFLEEVKKIRSRSEDIPSIEFHKGKLLNVDEYCDMIPLQVDVTRTTWKALTCPRPVKDL